MFPRVGSGPESIRLQFRSVGRIVLPICLAKSQSRRGGLDGRLEGLCTFDFELAAIEPAVAGRKKVSKIVASESEVRDDASGAGIMQLTRPAWSQTWTPKRVAT